MSEWSASFEDAHDGECDHCRRRRQVRYVNDPFEEEVNDKEIPSNWCRPCYRDCADEI